MNLFSLVIVSSLISQGQLISPVEYGYQPPKDRPEPQYVESQGKRGGDNQLVNLKILAPTDHIAKTISTHPEFWIQINQQHLVQYSLINDERQQLWQGELLPESQSFALKYPNNSPPLKPGIYILAVAVGCPENCTGIRIAFEQVEPSMELKQDLENVKDIEEEIKILAKAGFWYDAQSKLMETKKKPK